MIECALHNWLYVVRKFKTLCSLNEKTFWMSQYEKVWKKFVNFQLIRFCFLIHDGIEIFESSDKKISINLFLYALKLLSKFITKLTISTKWEILSTKKSFEKKNWHNFKQKNEQIVITTSFNF